MIYLQLYFEFFKTGLFAVGGGLATLPFLSDISEKTGWFTQADLANMIAVSESTPGPIGANMATYVGYTTAGLPGSFVASIGLISPAIIIGLIVSRFIAAFRTNKQVAGAFYGLRAASVGLIAAAGIAIVEIAMLTPEASLGSGDIFTFVRWKALVLAGILFVLLRKYKLHPIVVIIGSAIIGIVFQFAGL